MALSKVDGTNLIAATVPTTVGGTGSTATTFTNLTSNVTGTLPVASGGTGLTSGFVNGGTNTPAFEAMLSSTQSLVDATNTKIEFDTENFDTDGCYDNSTNYRFTPTTAGKYYIYGKVRLQSGSDSQFQTGSIFIYKNGSIVYENYYLFWSNYIRSASPMVSAVIDMNGSSDYVELYAALDVNSGTLDGALGNSNRTTLFGAYKILGA